MFNKAIAAGAALLMASAPAMAGEVGSSWSHGTSYRDGVGRTLVDGVSNTRETISGALSTTSAEQFSQLSVDGRLSVSAGGSEYEYNNPNFAIVDGGGYETSSGRFGRRYSQEYPDRVVILPGGSSGSGQSGYLDVYADNFEASFLNASSTSNFRGTLLRQTDSNSYLHAEETYNAGERTVFGSTSIFAR